MKKYNLSQIMKAAWEFRRTLVITMSAALKKAWAIAKEAKKMLGTEKQIKWATEIRTNVVKTLQAVIADLQVMSNNDMARRNISDIQVRIDLLNAENVHAGDIIDLFKDVRFSGDHRQDFEKVISVYRVSVANTAGQRTILMR